MFKPKHYEILHPINMFEEDEHYEGYKMAIKSHLVKMKKKNGEVIKMEGLVAMPDTFDETAPEISRRSTMAVSILTPIEVITNEFGN